ncbi:GlxA family transcriptional regulator [Pseudomonas sp. SCB32]|uniref:GlxA family transcriptional regulator n=1 Tax=Pseudomonas sp. SCB32 TaxID=2653853 RepID=UPI001264ADC7|nr:helix-turn-helix domain-containing protein [Pseudomonas sp. SCB32]
MKQVAILAYEGCWAMGLFSAADFFRIAALLELHVGMEQSFEVRLVSVDGAPVCAAGGHVITPDGTLADVAQATLIVLPAIEGPRLAHFEPDIRALGWLGERIDAGARVLALTTGAAWLAASGRMDGGLLATHWSFVRQLGLQYPASRFVARESFLQEGGLYSTGSLNGCFDALLDILAQERGDRFAQLCATHLLVADPHLLGPILPGHRNHCDETVLQVQDWIESHHAQPLTIERMARQAGVSARTFKRRFSEATRLPPNLYLQQVRIDKAKKLLLATQLAVREIAAEVGYENVSFFVRLFKARTGTTPARWRAGS